MLRTNWIDRLVNQIRNSSKLVTRRTKRKQANSNENSPATSSEVLEQRVVLDATYFSLASGPFSQDWSTTAGQLTTADNWNNVPNIIGYLGDYIPSSPLPGNSPGTDPQTVLVESPSLDLVANSNSAATSGGVHEVEASGTIALQGSGTADAPYIQIHLDATGQQGVTVAYVLKELDSTNVDQKFALQYRIGSTGDFVNVPAGAASGFSPAGNQTVSKSVLLPAAVNGQGLVQVRIITHDAASSDAMVGVDDIVVTSSPIVAASAPTVISPTATSITSSGVTLGGNVTGDGGGLITERGVVYSLTSANTDPLINGSGVTKVVVSGTTGVFTTAISGLTAAEGYLYKAYATNSAGTTYTAVDTFSTLATATAPTVINPTATLILESSATLGGEVTSDGGDAITERGVVYSLTSTNNDPIIGGSGVTAVTTSGTTGAFTIPISGLIASTGYSFKAYATNATGTTYTSVSTFATAVATTVLVRGDLVITGMNATNPDTLSFVTLVDLAPGTMVSFTDNGWDGTGLATAEGTIVYTAPAGGVVAGTKIIVTMDTGSPESVASVTGGGTAVASGTVAFNSTGESLIAYQGLATSPYLLFILNTNVSYVTGTLTNSLTQLPSVLTIGTTATAPLGQAISTTIANAEYNHVHTTATKASLLAQVGNEANWNRSTTAITLKTGNFTLGNTATGLQADKTVTVNPNTQDAALGITAPADINGDTFTITVTAIPSAAKGAVTKADGTILVVNDVLTVAELTELLFDTVSDATGAAGTFEYSVFDGTATSSQIVTLSIAELNDAPVNTVPGSQSTVKNTNLVFSTGNSNAISIADADADTSDVKVTLTATDGTVTLGGTSGLTITAGSNGSATVAFTGTISAINTALNGLVFAPTNNFTGSASLQIVTDDQGNTGSGGAKTDSDTISITVSAPGNTAPTLTTNAGLTLNQSATATITNSLLLVSDSDNSAAELTFTIGTAPTGGTLKKSGTSLVANDTFTQADINNSLITYVAGSSPASDSFTFTVSDGAGGSIGSTTFNITVTAPSLRLNEIYLNPGVTTDDNREYVELLSLTGGVESLAGLTLLIIEGDTGTAAGTIDGVVPLSSLSTGTNGLLLLGFNYLTTNPWSANTAAGTAVANLNGAGSAGTNVAAAGTLENGAITFLIVNGFTGAAANDLDTNNDGVFDTTPWTSIVDSVGWKGGAGSVYSAAALTQTSGTPDAATRIAGNTTVGSTTAWYNGDGDAVSATSLGYAPGQASANLPSGAVLTPGATNYEAVPNVAPINTVPGAQTANEDTVLAFTASNTISVTDADGNLATTKLTVSNGTLTVSLAGGATISAGANSSVTLTLAGTETQINAALATLTYQGNLNFNGSDTLTVLSSDSAGSPLTDSDTVAITVSSVNDAPSGTDATVATVQNTDHVFTAANFGFSDSSDSPADSLLAVTITTLPAAGSLSLSGSVVTAGQSIPVASITSGLLMFTPSTNETGSPYATFTFQVQDNGGVAGGGIDLDPTPNTLTINVTTVVVVVNHEPVGADKSITTNEDTDYIFAITDFGFTDPNDSSANTLVAVKITTLPAAGSLTNNGSAVSTGQFIAVGDITSGKLKFTPAVNASGATYASFTFQVQDNGGTANGGVDLDQSANTITIDVTAVNDAPAGADKTVGTLKNTDYMFVAADFGFTDPNDTPGNTLAAVTVTTLPLAGTLTNNGSAVTAGQSIPVADITGGLLKFSPATDAFASPYTTFTVQVQDNGGTSNGGVDLDQSPNTITVDVADFTTLGVGDIAFTGIQTDAPDTFSFVLLKDVVAGTTITFTDNGWGSNAFANTSENTATVTFDTARSAGTHLVVSDNSGTATFKLVGTTTSAGTVVGNLSGISASGDSILAYQGVTPTTNNATNWIAGINTQSFAASPSGSNQSDLPSALAIGVNAIQLSTTATDIDDGAYNKSSFTGTVAEIRASVNNIANWTTNDLLGPVSTTVFTVGSVAVSADLYINEVVFNPFSGTDTGEEYIELRGTPDAYVPADAYLVLLDGDSEDNAGEVDHIFFIGGMQFGSNGFLVLRQADSTYSVDVAATVFTATGTGWGTTFSSRTTDIENGSVSVLIIQSSSAPVVSTDVDSDNDGNLDSGLGWTVRDALGNIDGGANDTAYGFFNTSGNGSGNVPTGSTFVDISSLGNAYHPDYMARNGNSTGSVLADWVFGELAGTMPSISLAVGFTQPAIYGGAAIDDLGAVNTFGSNVAPLNTVPGARTVNEDTNLAFTAGNTISVTDADGNLATTQLTVAQGTLTVSLAGGATISSGANASLTLTLAGTESQINAALATVNYRGNLNFNGSDTLTVLSTDSAGSPLTDSDTVAITVTAVNDAPMANDSSFTTNEDTFFDGFVVFSDVDNLTADLTVFIQNDGPAVGSLVLLDSHTGAFRYTPPANYNGADSFTFHVFENVASGLISNTATVSITVTAVNDAPSFTLGANQTVLEDAAVQTVAGFLTAASPGPSNESSQTLSLGVTNNNNALFSSQPSINLSTGVLTYTPAANATGTATVSVTLTDSGSNSAPNVNFTTKTFTITLTAVNDAPVAVDDTATTAEDTALILTQADLKGNDTDIDNTNGQLSVTVVSNPTNGTVVLNGDGTITFTPATNFNGTAGFDYTLSDGSLSGAGHVTVVVTAVNDAPVAVDDTATTAEDTALILTQADLKGNDTDIDNTNAQLSVTAVSNPTNGTVALNGDGTITFTPASNFNGTASFDYTLSDGSLTDAGSVSVTITAVNDAPVAVDDSLLSVAEDSGDRTISIGSLTANDTDVDNTNTQLTITAVSNAVGGTVSIVGTDVIFTPTLNFNGAASFDYTLSDGNLTDMGVVSFTITVVNDSPTANPETLSVQEDSGDFGAHIIDVLANDSAGPADESSQTLTVTFVSALHGTVIIRADGRLDYSPDANYTGPDTISYAITDNGTTDGVADPKIASGTVSIKVDAVNDPPLAVGDTVSTNEDVALTLTQADLKGNDTDIDNTNAQLSVVAVFDATHGTVVRNGDGTITFTPALNFTGTAGFDYALNDGSSLTDIGHVIVNVGLVNDAPVAVDDSLTSIAEDSGDRIISIANLTANDTDVDNTNAQLTLTAVSNAVGGTVSIVGTDVVFTPTLNFNGVASFDYTLSDGNLTDTGSVSFTITAVNDAPVAVDDSLSSIAEDSGDRTISISSLTANDTDVDNTNAQLTLTAVSNAVGGTVSIVGTDVVFTPTLNFHGTASFEYTLSDGSLSDTGSVSSTITAVNDAPVAVDDSLSSIAEDFGDRTISIASLTANDTDVDNTNAQLTITAVSNPVGGTVTIVGTDVVFTPTLNFNGAASFDYTLSDGSLTDTGAVNFTITAVNDAPVFTSGTVFSVAEANTNGVTGAQSSASPYLTSTNSDVKFTSILTVGDAVSGYRMVGIPDGMGVYDNNDGTFTLLLNHEINNTLGIARAHGQPGSFISRWVISKSSLEVLSIQDFLANGTSVFLSNNNPSTGTVHSGYLAAATTIMSRLCSADLAAPGAYLWDDGLGTVYGTTARIFQSGEESGGSVTGVGPETTTLFGRQFAFIATDDPNTPQNEAGTAYELPHAGLFSWENNLANPLSQRKTIVMGMDDGSPIGQIYMWVGDKQTTGNVVERAGLTKQGANDNMYVLRVPSLATVDGSGVPIETLGAPVSGAFTMVNEGDVSGLTFPGLEALSDSHQATQFLRPEDGQWDPANPSDFYFVTTSQYDQVKDGIGSTVGRSRLYKLHFSDIANPEAGGTITCLLDGTEAGNMFDNMTISNGKVILQEDVGNQQHLGKIWSYDIATDTLTQLAQHDRTRFGDVGVAAVAPFNQDEESSGVVDLSAILGAETYLVNVQSHYSIPGELVEGGQLLLMQTQVASGSQAVTTVTASDAESNSLTFSITGGSDAADFVIDPVTGALSFVVAADFEAPVDSDTNNVYEVIVSVTDGTNPAVSQTIQVTVTDVNETPTNTTVTTVSVAENTTAVTTATGTDPEGVAVTFAISGGADGSKFSINATTGELTFVSAPNFEAPTDNGANNSYFVTVTVSDGVTPAVNKTVVVTVTNVNEAPTIAPQTFSVAENTANGVTVGTVVASDVDAGDSKTFVITGGNILGAFAISPAGVITVADTTKLDFETNPTFSLTVSVTDGGSLSASTTITINLTNVNEAPTIAPQTFSVAENTANGVTVGTVVASDVDAGDSKTFTITGGNALGAFAISTAGVITVADTTKLNFETNPTFSLTVKVTDAGGLFASTTVTINLTNVNEAPVAVNGSLSTTQGVAKSGTLVVTDVDSSPTQLTISVVTGPSHGTVLITDVHTGAYTYTPTAGYNGPDSFTFKANDGALNSNIGTVAITVVPNVFVSPPPLIIDNADASGYSETGSWKNKAAQGPSGYLGNLRYAHPQATVYTSTAYDNGIRVGNPGDVEFATANVDIATYTFTNLPAGTYKIGVTYKAATNRATNASFTVSGTGASTQTVQINQQLIPNSFTTGIPASTGWQTLIASYGSVSANGTITVTLTSAGANGYVIADAVLVQQIAPLEAASGAAASPVDQTLSSRDLQRVANEAISRWKDTNLTNSQLTALNGVQFQVQDLGGAILGVDDSNVITIDNNAAGYGWFIDKTLKTDREFVATDSQTELHAPVGSRAFGKMDLLTVVMHELGHVMGLGHSADETSVMTNSIEVGVRRIELPTHNADHTARSGHIPIRIATGANDDSVKKATAVSIAAPEKHANRNTTVARQHAREADPKPIHSRMAKSAGRNLPAESDDASLDLLFATGFWTSMPE